MGCVYKYKGKTYDRDDFTKILLDMKPSEAPKYMPWLNPVPDAPFVGSTNKWAMLAFKRMVRMAAEEGFDKIAWTPGDVQADRYDLSKQVDAIRITKRAKGWSFDAKKDGDNLIFKEGLSDNELEENVGKDLAEKAIDDLKANQDTKVYSGLDLKVGGEGMKGFYDKILPAAVNKFFNKKAWGKAKVGVGEIAGIRDNSLPSMSGRIEIAKRPSTETADIAGNEARFFVVSKETDANIAGPFYTKEEAQETVDKYIDNPRTNQQVWTLPITEKMRDKAISQGMPMFTRADKPANVSPMTSKKGPGDITTQDNLLIPEGGNVFEDSLPLPFEEGVPSADKVNALKKWLSKNTDKYNPKYVTLYHSTGANVPILEQGIKPTSATRRRSYQSHPGYVYLAPTPERAKIFGDLGNSSNSKTYAVKVQVQNLRADRDQLNNQRAVGEDVGNSVAESLIYGGSARVKGKIELWQIKELPNPSRPSSVEGQTPTQLSVTEKKKFDADEYLKQLVAQQPEKKRIERVVTESPFMKTQKEKLAEKAFKPFMYWIVDRNSPIATVQKKLHKVHDKIDVFLKETQRPKVTAAKTKQAWDKDIVPLIDKMAEYKVNVQDLELYKHALHAQEANRVLRRTNAKSQVLKFKTLFDNAGAEEKVKWINKASKDAKGPDSWYKVLNQTLEQFKDDKTAKPLIDSWQNFQEKPSGMTDAESKQILKEHEGDTKIKELGRMLDVINDKKLKLLYDSGLLADEEYAAIKNKYKHYVPLHRAEFDQETLPGVGRGLLPSGRQIKVRGGSTKEVVNILAHSIANYERAISASEKARSQRALFGLIQANPDSNAIWMTKERKTPRYDTNGNLRLYPDLHNVSPYQMRLMVNGNQYLVEIDKTNKDAELMLRTLKAEDNMAGPITNVLSKFNRFLSRVNTSWSPEFIVSNFVRDIQTAHVNIQDTGVKGGSMIRGAKDAWKAIWAVERGRSKGTELEAYYERFKKAGGKIGWADVHGSIENLSKKLTKELEMRSGKRPKRKMFNDLIQVIEDANTSIENGVRLHVFKQAIEQGATDERAAQIASDLTVDFTKKGAAGPAINALYLFANAGIQGSYRIFRAAKSPKVRKMMAGIAGVGFAVGILNALAGGDDDDGEDYFNNIDDFIRERNMIIMLPGTKGKFLKIPLPWGYNVIWNIGTEASRAFTKKDYSPLASAGRLATNFANAFNPVAAGTLLQTLSPTITDPFAQVAENKNWFGGPLMPENNKYAKVKTPDSQRYWRSTGVVSKWVSGKLNWLTGGDKVKAGVIDVSPETLNLIADTIGGSALRFAKDTFGVPFKVIQGEDVAMHEIPFVRRVFAEKSEWSDSRRFYQNRDRIYVAEARLKAYQGTDNYRPLVKATKFERSMIYTTKITDKRLRRLRKILKRARVVGNQEYAKKVEKRINEVYEQYNRLYNQAYDRVQETEQY